MFGHRGGTERIALFVDGANLWASSKALNFQLDFKKLLGFFKNRDTYVVAAYYFTAIDENNDGMFKLVDMLSYHGWSTITKLAKSYSQPSGPDKIKGNMDVEFTIKVLELCPHLDRAILFTGDGDFKELVSAVQTKGCRVTVVSTMATNPPMVSNDLRKVANEFIDLAAMREALART